MTKSVIITGNKEFDNYELVKSYLDKVINNTDYEIVTGFMSGVERLADIYAHENKFFLKTFQSNNIYKSKALDVRNENMIAYADSAIIFTDGKSAFVNSFVEMCMGRNFPFTVVGI